MFNNPRRLELEYRHFSEERYPRTGEDEGMMGLNSDVKIRISNHSDKSIFTKDRTGLCRITHPVDDSKKTFRQRNDARSKPCVEIFYCVYIPRESRVQALAHYEDQSAYSPLSANIYDKLLRMHRDRQHSNFVEITIQIPIKDIMDYDGVIYLEDLDIVLGLGTGEGVEHPDSPEMRNRRRTSRFVRDMEDLDENSLVVSIEAIDNSGENHYEDRYISICNDIYRVPVRRDRGTRKTGVYIRRKPTLDEISDGMSELILHDHYMTFEEAEERLGLSRTIEAARGSGSSKLALDVRLSESTLRNKELDLELASLKRIHEKENLEHKAKMDEMKHQMDEQAAEWAKEKAHIEKERIKEDDQRQKQKAERDERLSKDKHERDMDKMDLMGFLDSIKSGIAIAAVFASTVAWLAKTAKP